MNPVHPARRIAAHRLFLSSLPIRSRPSLPSHLRHSTRHASSDAPGSEKRPSRSASDFNSAKQSTNPPQPRANPVLAEYQRKYRSAADDRQARAAAQAAVHADAQQTPGDLGASSIFEFDRRTQIQGERAAAREGDVVPVARDDDDAQRQRPAARDLSTAQAVLDPDPNARERWQRKQVVRLVRRSGRVRRAALIQRTEREHLVRSHNMKTSVKKLGMLARQIAGKTLEEAIVQMRFSKKRVAQEVLKQLEFARDEAVVMRGMGLGRVGKIAVAADAADAGEATAGTPAPSLPPSLDIQLKDGKRHTVTDPCTIYIDQAWVGRGPYGQLPDYRARGRVFKLRTPWTSISVLLKEEATRVREWRDREDKRRRQRVNNVWVPLPDRPISTKQPWYSW